MILINKKDIFAKTRKPVVRLNSATELRRHNRPVHEMTGETIRLAAPSLKEINDCQENDGSKQRDQHGRNGERIIDGPDVKDRAKEVASQECAQDGHNDIDQQV